jgi:5'-3' exonuclease
MTIKGINKELKGTKKKNGIVPRDTWEYVHLEAFRGHRIGIDVMWLLYRYYAASISRLQKGRESNSVPPQDVVLKYTMGLFYDLIDSLVHYGILPVAVLDGKPSKLKTETRANRNNISAGYADQAMDAEERLSQLGDDDESLEEKMAVSSRLETAVRGSIRLGQEEVDHVTRFLSLMGIPVIVAPKEAEGYLANLIRLKQISAAMSADSDLLAHGAAMIITDIFYGKGPNEKGVKPSDARGKDPLCVMPINYVEVVIMSNILYHLGYTMDRFLDLCVMCGTDYAKNVEGFGPVYCKKLLDKYHSLDEMPDEADASFIRKTLPPFKKGKINEDKGGYRKIKRKFKHDVLPVEPWKIQMSEAYLPQVEAMAVCTRGVKSYAKNQPLLMEEDTWKIMLVDIPSL